MCSTNVIKSASGTTPGMSDHVQVLCLMRYFEMRYESDRWSFIWSCSSYTPGYTIENASFLNFFARYKIWPRGSDLDIPPNDRECSLSFTLSCQGTNRPLRTDLHGLSDPMEGERSRANKQLRNERRAKFSWPLPTPYFALACNFVAIARIVENWYTAPYIGIRRNISFNFNTNSVVFDILCS